MPNDNIAPAKDTLAETPDSRAKAIGFVNDSDLRRWCVSEVIRSKVCFQLSTEVRALYDFLTEKA
jgi:hypothetical protein